MGAFQRIGGSSGLNAVADTVTFLQNQMERTVGNFDTSMGQEPTRVTTASGIAQMNERADARKNIKKADRNTGFQQLFELIDWTCLEFYDEERMIFIGAITDDLNKRYAEITQGQFAENMDREEGPIVFKYSSSKMAIKNNREELYFPKVDCSVNASDSLVKSKAFSIQAIQDIIATNVTPQNVELIKEYIDLLGLPSRKMIKESLDKALGIEKVDDTMPSPDDILSQLTDEERREIVGSRTYLGERSIHVEGSRPMHLVLVVEHSVPLHDRSKVRPILLAVDYKRLPLQLDHYGRVVYSALGEALDHSAQ
jgi:hypothetical protein